LVQVRYSAEVVRVTEYHFNIFVSSVPFLNGTFDFEDLIT